MKTVFITGANKSIGFEAARQLAENNYYVYMGCRNVANGEEAVAKLNEKGIKNVEALQIDVTDETSIARAAKYLEEKISSLDVLINNAGISGGFPQTATQVDTATIRKVFDTNFFGAINVTHAMMELLKKSDAPRIVNVTSGLASLTLHTDPSWRFYQFKSAAYGPSKTALNAYTIALAYELRDTPFKVNAVDPGFTATDFNQHRGTGNVTDAAARLVKFAMLNNEGPTGQFFSDDNNSVTGISPW